MDLLQDMAALPHRGSFPDNISSSRIWRRQAGRVRPLAVSGWPRKGRQDADNARMLVADALERPAGSADRLPPPFRPAGMRKARKHPSLSTKKDQHARRIFHERQCGENAGEDPFPQDSQQRVRIPETVSKTLVCQPSDGDGLLPVPSRPNSAVSPFLRVVRHRFL